MSLWVKQEIQKMLHDIDNELEEVLRKELDLSLNASTCILHALNKWMSAHMDDLEDKINKSGEWDPEEWDPDY